MQVTIKWFASLREKRGESETTYQTDAVDQLSLTQLWQAVCQQPQPDNIFCAINHEHSHWQALVKDGDEVAFFPQITGG